MEFVEPDGTVHLIPLDVPYPSAVHDIWLSEDFVIVPIQPLYIDHERVRRGIGMLHGWDPELELILVLISRTDWGQIRTIRTGLEPQYVLHTMSANRDDNILTLDAPIYERPPYPFEDRVPYGTPWVPFDTAKMGRWLVDLDSGAVKSEFVDDRACEFPKMDERFYGKPYRNGFLLAGKDLWSLNTVVKRDVQTGAVDEYRIESESLVSICEPQFAPRSSDSPEGDGYLLAAVTYVAERRTDYLIFDTEKIEEGPVATVALPHQVPWTPHGCWM
jgi:carotenoid cleavage dioxygenase